MLSATTIQMLEDLAQRSHAHYPEGGLIYTFTEAAKQAHSKFPTPFAGRRRVPWTELDRTPFARVVCRSLGNPGCTEADADSLAIADDLLQRLAADLQFSHISVVVDDSDDYSWAATIHMARASDNRYFSLSLLASID